MITFGLNGQQVTTKREATSRLLDVLREDFGLTGPKEGCGEGECGACAVLIDGELVNSCLVATGDVVGHEVLTIEGYRETEQFRILAKVYEEVGAVQCGFCTPGMIMASEYLLSQNNQPTDEEIRIALSGNLCRCTGYEKIIQAIQIAAARGAGRLW